MRMPRPHQNIHVMLTLTIFSVVCILILVGGYFYSGSVVPSTSGASPEEARSIWTHWMVIVAIPSVTLALWVLRLATGKKQ